MQYIGYVLGAVCALVAILMIAIPERFFKPESEKKKIVGPSYWGSYSNTKTEPEEYKCIESIVYPGKDPTLAGSRTYDLGRGVKE